MSFDVADGLGGNVCVSVCHRNRRCLPLNAGSSKACFGSAIVVDADTFDDRVDSIAVRNRIDQSLNDDHARSVAEQRAGCLAIERATMAVRRHDIRSLVCVS